MKLVLEQIDRIVTSPEFLRAERMSAFLRFIVDRTLAGRAAELKETTLGVELYGRPPGYDPKVDPIVRVDARRLRAKLNDYYESPEGSAARIRVELPTGGYVPEFVEANATPVTQPSIVVLPFANRGAGDFIADGVTDELIHALSKDPGLRVVARTTTFQLRANAEPLAEIGRRLNAAYFVDGAVRAENESLVLTVQLIDAANSFVLWSEQYTGGLSAVQEEIASAIGSFIRTVRGHADRPARPHKPPHPEAHVLYLKGLYFWNKQTAEGIEKGLAHFQQAIQADPNYALAHTGLAYALVLLGNWGAAPSSHAYPAARAACQRALELDDSLAQAHLALGAIHAFHDWDWPAANACIERAIRLNPSATRAPWPTASRSANSTPPSPACAKPSSSIPCRLS